MVQEPLVSVVMPVRNRERLVAEAIASLRRQTFSRWELIVIDDASTDGTAQAVRALAVEDRRIRLLSVSKQSSIAAVRNHGLRIAAAPLIAGMDSDDLSHPDRLERLVRELEKRPDIAAISSWALKIDGQGKEEGAVRTSCHSVDLHWETPLVDPLLHPASMIRREALMAVGGYDESYALCEDSRLWVMLDQKGYRFSVVGEELYSLRWHTDNVTQRPESAVCARRAYASYWKSPEPEYPARAIAWIDEALGSLAGNLLIWGTGIAARLLIEWCSRHQESHPIGFIERDPGRRGSSFHGLPVHSPSDLERLVFDRIAIASLPGQAEIEAQLQSRGFTRERDFMPVARLLAIRGNLAAEIRDGR